MPSTTVSADLLDIKKLKAGKTAGCDEIRPKMLKTEGLLGRRSSGNAGGQ